MHNCRGILPARRAGGTWVAMKMGRRIFALSLRAGDTLQVYLHELSRGAILRRLSLLLCKLLVPVFRRLRHSDAVEEVVALCDV